MAVRRRLFTFRILVSPMTDDYLLQEFHEAGIWLPGEKEVVFDGRLPYADMAAYESELHLRKQRLALQDRAVARAKGGLG